MPISDVRLGFLEVVCKHYPVLLVALAALIAWGCSTFSLVADQRRVALHIAITAAGVFFVVLVGILRHSRITSFKMAGLDTVDTMTGVEFEQRLSHAYSSLGWKVSTTPVSGDFGADLLLDDVDERIVLQAKRYCGSVGIEAVQQVVGAIAHYRAARGIVVTNSYFTPAAVALAESNRIDLIDRDAVTELLARQAMVCRRQEGLSLLAHQAASGLRLVSIGAFGVLVVVAAILGYAVHRLARSVR